jgi:methyl-accepting chemotaxis protein
MFALVRAPDRPSRSQQQYRQDHSCLQFVKNKRSGWRVAPLPEGSLWNSIMAMFRLSIRARIFGGMGILVLLGVALAGRGAWELARIDNQITRLSVLSDNNIRVLQIERLMETMRAASLVLKFSTTQSALDPDDATDSLKMEEMLQEASKTARSEQQRQGYQSMLGGCTSCHSLAADLGALSKQVEDNRGKLFSAGDQMAAAAAKLHAAAHRFGHADIAAAAGDVEATALLIQANHWRFLSTGDPEAAAAVKTNATAATAALGVLGKLELPEDIRVLLGTVSTALTAYGETFATVSSAASKTNELFDKQMVPLVRQQMAAAKDVAASLGKDFASTKDATSGMITRAVAVEELTAGVALVLGVLIATFVGRGIVRPVRGMTTAMAELAAGETEVNIPSRGTGHEMGAMAAALEVFKQNAVERARLEAGQKAEAERAARAKQAALVAMADKVETEMGTTLKSIGGRTATMMQAAEEMSASASRTGTSAESAASAATQTLSNAQTVASAAEELAASIREIGSQVSQSTVVVGRAVAAGGETRATMEKLNEQVGRIGAVADMIGEIAAKTNLLALNATIEAARAGEAGKGFAVVAGEVKQLATQTTQSTHEITRHIGEVRDATGASVAAMGRIQQTIDEINAIANSIAAAVEEQGVATAEIARNVTETAGAAREMTRRINEVSMEAQSTGRDTQRVRENTAALNSEVSELQHAVIRVVRSATTDVDRRPVDSCTADLG